MGLAKLRNGLHDFIFCHGFFSLPFFVGFYGFWWVLKFGLRPKQKPPGFSGGLSSKSCSVQISRGYPNDSSLDTKANGQWLRANG